MIKICKIHGSTEFTETTIRSRCKKCRTAAVNKRRRKLKLLSIEYKGGKCEKCGYDKCPNALDFHHLDPTTKEFGISEVGHTRSWERLRKEVDKCILVCRNCHAEIHYYKNDQ